MPITQASMIEQMQEARAAHAYGRTLRDMILTYAEMAQRRYPKNTELQEVLTAFIYNVRMTDPPDDRTTWINEKHYSKVTRQNDKTRERQEIARRMAGVPTADEAIAILNARNALRRADLPTSADAYHLPKSPISKSQQEIAAERLLADDLTPQPKLSRPNIIMPRDEPDDAPLEFDLPPGATLDLGGPKLLDENNLLTGVDIAADLPDDSESQT